MKRLAKSTVWMVMGFLSSACISADAGVSPGSPFAPVGARNIFGLSPPSAPKTEPQSSSPLPQITPNGIMSILGQPQVLFKVTVAATPGQPVKDVFYTLGEGERQDGIEVTHIDENAAAVSFNNHGTLQEISLAGSAEDSDASPTVWIMGRGNIGNHGFHGPDLDGNLPMHDPGSAITPNPNVMTPETQTILKASQPLQPR